MSQPIKKSGTYQKPRSKTVRKSNSPTSRAKNTPKDKRLPAKPKTKRVYVRKHAEFGTSKLEERFAHDFLEKLGVRYVYQYKAESIGRYFDFYLPDDNVLIEVDGDFYHSYGLVYEEMSPMQKRNRRVDELKSHWALVNCIPLIRIWEHDINKNPRIVMEMLKKELYSAKKQKEIDDKKKQRHNGNVNYTNNTSN